MTPIYLMKNTNIMITEIAMQNFKDACNFLADQNIYVFRMGSKVRKKISFQIRKSLIMQQTV